MTDSNVWLSLSAEVERLHATTTFLGLLSLLFDLTTAVVAGRLIRLLVSWLWRLNLDPKKRLASAGILFQFGVFLLLFMGMLSRSFTVAPGVTLLITIVGGPTVGLVLSSQIQNVLAGLSLIYQRDLREGDNVRLPGGITARLIQIRLVSTIAQTEDGVQFILPNTALASQIVQKEPNFSGIGLSITLCAPHPLNPDALQIVRNLLLLSPYRAAGTPVNVGSVAGGTNLELSLRLVSAAAKEAATRELYHKIPSQLGWK